MCEKCSGAYWTIFAVPLALTAAFSCTVFRYKAGTTEGQVDSGGVTRSCGIWLESISRQTQHCSFRFTLQIITFGFIFGAIAGLVGIGGGEFIGPMLLWLGLEGVKASAMSALAVLFAVSSDVIHYAIHEELTLLWEYCVLLCPLAFIVALGGRVLLLQWVRHTNRQSVVILVLCSVLGLCAMLAFYEVSKHTANWDKFKPNGVCEIK